MRKRSAAARNSVCSSKRRLQAGAHDATTGRHIGGEQFHSRSQSREVHRAGLDGVSVNVEAMQNGGGREHLFLQMPEEIAHRATDFKDRANIPGRVQAARPKVSRNPAKQNTPRRIYVRGSKPRGDLIRCRIGQMVRPKETVELNGIATARIVQYPHRELDTARQPAASNPSYKSPPRGQRKNFPQQPRCPSDHLTNCRGAPAPQVRERIHCEKRCDGGGTGPSKSCHKSVPPCRTGMKRHGIPCVEAKND